MNIKVQLNNLRTAPRKVRLVADLIRSKNVQQARYLLSFTVNKSSEPMIKLLNSAVASALNNFKLEEPNLYISKITVDEGPKLKRWHPMSRGRAYPIMKRTSNITLVLSDKNEEKGDKKKVIKQEKIIEKTQKLSQKPKKTIKSVKK